MAIEGTKTIKHQGIDVEVSCERRKRQEGEAHDQRYLVTARIGETTYQHSHTIGPDDGEIQLPSKEQLQKDLDAARTQAVKHVHFRHHIEKLLPELD
jgi:hypothetical protein